MALTLSQILAQHVNHGCVGTRSVAKSFHRLKEDDLLVERDMFQERVMLPDAASLTWGQGPVPTAQSDSPSPDSWCRKAVLCPQSGKIKTFQNEKMVQIISRWGLLWETVDRWTWTGHVWLSGSGLKTLWDEQEREMLPTRLWHLPGRSVIPASAELQISLASPLWWLLISAVLSLRFPTTHLQAGVTVIFSFYTFVLCCICWFREEQHKDVYYYKRPCYFFQYNFIKI